MPNLSTRKSTNKIIFIMYLISGGFVLCTALLGLFISSVQVPIPTILHIIAEKAFGWGWLEEVPKNVEMIIWNIRFPRVLLALCVGAALALAGAAFQGLLRNPLADPYTIGVSSGAALGAVTVIFFGLQLAVLGAYTLPVFAIIGGILTLALVYGMVRISNASFSIETIILAGIIISSFIGALISLIIALSGEELRQIVYWLMGSVSMRGWSYVGLIFPFLAIGSGLILMHARELNAMAFGEESAQHVGVNIHRSKKLILLGASLLTGAAVAVSGSIGFVGLVIPHLVRLVVGYNHKHVLPLAMLSGGAFLILADLLARTIIEPKELPIGVVTALIGAPVFAVLLLKERIRRGGR